MINDESPERAFGQLLGPTHQRQQQLIDAFLRLAHGQDGARLMHYMGIRQAGPLSYVLPTLRMNQTEEASSALVSMSNFRRNPRPELPQVFKESLLNLIAKLAHNEWNSKTECFDTAEERYALCEKAETFINAVAEQLPSPFMEMIQQAVEGIKNGYADEILRDRGLRDTCKELMI